MGRIVVRAVSEDVIRQSLTQYLQETWNEEINELALQTLCEGVSRQNEGRIVGLMKLGSYVQEFLEEHSLEVSNLEEDKQMITEVTLMLIIGDDQEHERVRDILQLWLV
ncbi:hypothetical protein [Shimazuella kribbensis]|uniref:hypothetical protein n=1 Tax=Shimazuella kribbensis TaxID=139808 RepID=UPI00048FB056|nr:hypothetical protein [Shimazuella kribbensis]